MYERVYRWYHWISIPVSLVIASIIAPPPLTIIDIIPHMYWPYEVLNKRYRIIMTVKGIYLQEHSNRLMISSQVLKTNANWGAYGGGGGGGGAFVIRRETVCWSTETWAQNILRF